jgi:hypothetical protein
MRPRNCLGKINTSASHLMKCVKPLRYANATALTTFSGRPSIEGLI